MPVQIIDRDDVQILGPTAEAEPKDLPEVVPALWKEAFAAHDDDAVYAELSEEPGGDTHVITVGVLTGEPAPGAVVVPGGRWLHHEHRGPVTRIGETYGRMFAYARAIGARVGRFKLDVGYRADGSEDVHDLYVELEA
jgi:hypothetical protein